MMKMLKVLVGFFKLFYKLCQGNIHKQFLPMKMQQWPRKSVKFYLTLTRLCVWHMNQNACKHLAGVVPEYKKFNSDFQHCIYDIEDEEEFISAWNEMKMGMAQ